MSKRCEADLLRRTVLVHFPDFEIEYRFTKHAFSVGDRIMRNGSAWTVTEVRDGTRDRQLTITVREADDALVEPAPTSSQVALTPQPAT